MEDHRKAAETYPLIKEFVDLVDNTADDGVLDFAELQTPPFIKFWKNLIIMRYLEESDDFVSILCGSEAVHGFGNEITGQMLTEIIPHDDARRMIKQQHLDALNGRKRIFWSGKLDWNHKQCSTWYQVKMPLQRQGNVNETLTCICFD